MNHIVAKLSENPDLIYEDKEFLKYLLDTLSIAYTEIKETGKKLKKEDQKLKNDDSYRVLKEAIIESQIVIRRADELLNMLIRFEDEKE